jgi:hypothetical protein
MPVPMLRSRLAQLGVIRLGEKKATQNGGIRPAKLSNFRFTTPSQKIAKDVAALLGGTPRPWQNTTGPEWEVYTDASEISVLIPPQVVDPNFEMWGNGYRSRLCNGEPGPNSERIRNAPCACRARYGDDFTRTAPKDQVCKVTFRVSLVVRDLAVGSWKLESHGWNAAAEMPGLVNAIAAAQMMLPGTLLLDRRQKKILDPTKPEGKQIEQRDYVVPVLTLDGLTSGQAFGRELATVARQVLGGGEQRAALTAGPAPDQQPATPAEWIALIDQADTAAGLDQLRERMQAAAVRDKTVVDAWMAKAAATAPAVSAKPATPAAAAPKASTAAADEPKGVIVDAVVVENEPMTGGTAWMKILELAGTKGWNLATTAGLFIDHYGFDYRDDRAVDAVLVEFLGKLQRGEVTA